MSQIVLLISLSLLLIQKGAISVPQSEGGPPPESTILPQSTNSPSPMFSPPLFTTTYPTVVPSTSPFLLPETTIPPTTGALVPPIAGASTTAYLIHSESTALASPSSVITTTIPIPSSLPTVSNAPIPSTTTTTTTTKPTTISTTTTTTTTSTTTTTTSTTKPTSTTTASTTTTSTTTKPSTLSSTTIPTTTIPTTTIPTTTIPKSSTVVAASLSISLNTTILATTTIATTPTTVAPVSPMHVELIFNQSLPLNQSTLDSYVNSVTSQICNQTKISRDRISGNVTLMVTNSNTGSTNRISKRSVSASNDTESYNLLVNFILRPVDNSSNATVLSNAEYARLRNLTLKFGSVWLYSPVVLNWTDYGICPVKTCGNNQICNVTANYDLACTCPAGQSCGTSDAAASSTSSTNSSLLWLIVIPVVLVILLIIAVVIVVCRKNDKEKSAGTFEMSQARNHNNKYEQGGPGGVQQPLPDLPLYAENQSRLTAGENHAQGAKNTSKSNKNDIYQTMATAPDLFVVDFEKKKDDTMFSSMAKSDNGDDTMGLF